MKVLLHFSWWRLKWNHNCTFIFLMIFFFFFEKNMWNNSLTSFLFEIPGGNDEQRWHSCKHCSYPTGEKKISFLFQFNYCFSCWNLEYVVREILSCMNLWIFNTLDEFLVEQFNILYCLQFASIIPIPAWKLMFYDWGSIASILQPSPHLLDFSFYYVYSHLTYRVLSSML